MFGFFNKVFFTAITFFSFNGIAFNTSNVDSLKCVSVNSQECRTRTKTINIKNNEPVFYSVSIKY